MDPDVDTLGFDAFAKTPGHPHAHPWEQFDNLSRLEAGDGTVYRERIKMFAVYKEPSAVVRHLSDVCPHLLTKQKDFVSGKKEGANPRLL